ncbi:hypothetical protein A5821_003471 [Enterococcus sp. 7F3_DIV0205]|uniref:Uncharacterized protein n=1 Tax=Candidatus Enterococcus palustris TaxID=1834189 RepID=A0AAQ3WBS2_9ENTE
MFLEFSESFYQILLTFSFIRYIVNKSFYLSHAILIFIDFFKRGDHCHEKDKQQSRISHYFIV